MQCVCTMDRQSQVKNQKTYSELMQFETFVDRFRYLQLDGDVGIETFGFDRYLNQILYKSSEWKKVRRRVIIRDNGCDLAHPDYQIREKILIHHINPITVEDIKNRDPKVFDLENLITTSFTTHTAIHYSDESILSLDPVERQSGDTKLW